LSLNYWFNDDLINLISKGYQKVVIREDSYYSSSRLLLRMSFRTTWTPRQGFCRPFYSCHLYMQFRDIPSFISCTQTIKRRDLDIPLSVSCTQTIKRRQNHGSFICRIIKSFVCSVKSWTLFTWSSHSWFSWTWVASKPLNLKGHWITCQSWTVWERKGNPILSNAIQITCYRPYHFSHR